MVNKSPVHGVSHINRVKVSKKIFLVSTHCLIIILFDLSGSKDKSRKNSQFKT